MKGKNKSKKKLLLVIILLLVGLSLGYALLTQVLTITGTAKVKANNWSVHFASLTPNPNNVTLSTGDSAATISNNTDISFTVTLNEPGDFYEFNVNVVNDGSIDAMINSITKKLNNVEISSTNPIPSYLDFSVKYSDGVDLAPKHILAATGTTSQTLTVRVAFKTDIENSQLPTTNASMTFNVGIEYVQADSTAIAKPNP